jgi:hypothetical protein
MRTIICLLLLSLASCSRFTANTGKEDGNGSNAAIVAITIAPSSDSIAVGNTLQFVGFAEDKDSAPVTDATLIWKSSDTSKASIDSQGLATAIAAGTTTITASNGNIVSIGATLTIIAADSDSTASNTDPLAITSGKPSTGTAGSAYSFTVKAAGGVSPYTWGAAFIAPDGYKGGLSINTSTGEITGVPLNSGTTPLLIGVTDAEYHSLGVQYAFKADGTPSIRTITNTPPNVSIGSGYTFTFLPTWTVASTACSPNLRFIEGTLPPGLAINLLDGSLGKPSNPATAGTVLAAGQYTFTVAASQSAICLTAPTSVYTTDANTFTITVTGTGSAPAGASNWTRQFSTPVITVTSTWDAAGIGSPSVIKVGSTYLMAYEGFDATTHRFGIGVATSSDGVAWTVYASNPIIKVGTAGTFDALGARYPTLHYDGTTYRLWYQALAAIDSSTTYSQPMIGLATSTDGIHWTKNASPVFSTAYGGAGYTPGTVIKTGSEFVMWYSDGYNAIGRATSSDGIHWTDGGTVTGSVGFRPAVVLDGTTYRMWFTQTTNLGASISAVATMYSTSIGFASSTNGIAWTVFSQSTSSCFFCTSPQQNVPLFSMGAAGAWDRPGVGDAAVLLDGSVFKMWYSGGLIYEPHNQQTFINGSIGYAKIP